MPAPYRDTLPKIVWEEATSNVTEIISEEDNEVADGWLSNGWALYEERSGGPYLEGFGAPGSRAASSFGPMPPATQETSFFTDAGDSPFIDWAVLGGWVYPGSLICLETRTGWAEKVFTGLTPGDTVGFTFTLGYVLDDGGGNPFAEIEGVTTTRFSPTNGGQTFWTWDGRPLTDNGYISTVVPGSGEVIVRLGVENAGPVSANGQYGFGGFILANITCDVTTVERRLDFAYPIEEVRSWREPREGSVHRVYPSGAEASFLRGHDGFLSGEVRWVPRQTTVDPLNDGWEDTDAGVKGWQRFLAWARRGGNTFRFHPDKDDDDLFYDCVLVDPRSEPDPEDDMTRGFPFRIRTVDGSLVEGY